ncbi:MAG: GAF domain-containing protein [Deltaproteobacteria bacterium]|nr:MAG: GAF domain-containing protein [Deltaproteobacteria bacterium]
MAEGEESREIRIPIGSGIAGWVAQHNQMLNIDDAYADPRFNPEVDKRTNYRTKSILCGPIINLQGETLGVIQVINKKAVHLTGTMKPFSRPSPTKQPLPSKTFSSTKRFCPVMKKWQSCWMWPPLCHRR